MAEHVFYVVNNFYIIINLHDLQMTKGVEVNLFGTTEMSP